MASDFKVSKNSTFEQDSDDTLLTGPTRRQLGLKFTKVKKEKKTKSEQESSASSINLKSKKKIWLLRGDIAPVIIFCHNQP